MTLPTSGEISLQDIEDEFGGTGAISLQEYYGTHPDLPESGQIKVKDF